MCVKAKRCPLITVCQNATQECGLDINKVLLAFRTSYSPIWESQERSQERQHSDAWLLTDSISSPWKGEVAPSIGHKHRYLVVRQAQILIGLLQLLGHFQFQPAEFQLPLFVDPLFVPFLLLQALALLGGWGRSA